MAIFPAEDRQRSLARKWIWYILTKTAPGACTGHPVAEPMVSKYQNDKHHKTIGTDTLKARDQKITKDLLKCVVLSPGYIS